MKLNASLRWCIFELFQIVSILNVDKTKNKMKKTVIFHVLFVLAFITIVSVPTVWSVILGAVSVALLYNMLHHMSRAEIEAVTGANFYNKVFNTNDFTRE